MREGLVVRWDRKEWSDGKLEKVRKMLPKDKIVNDVTST